MTFKMDHTLEAGQMNVEGKRMVRPCAPVKGPGPDRAFAHVEIPAQIPLQNAARAGARTVAALRFALLLAVFAGFAASLGAQGRVLTTAAEVHDLPADQAALSLPVHLVATATYVQADRYTLFVADATGSVFVLNPPGGVTLHRGDLVDVKGVTGPSFRTLILKPEVRLLGKGVMPVPRQAEFRELIAGDRDCGYVSVRGRIRSATADSDPSGTIAQLELLMPGGVVQAWLQDDTGVDLKSLIDAEVELRAVAGGRFNGRQQLMKTVLDLTDRRELTVLSPPQVKLADLPLTPIVKVLPTRFVVDESQRVKVRGTVTFFEPGNSVVVQQDGEGLLAGTNDLTPLALGSVVDVVGFADEHGYGPMLADAQILPTGLSAEVTAKPLSFADAIGGKFSDSLISLRGTVLSVLHGEISDSMVIMVDQHPVNVRLGERHFPDLPVGTQVTISGICRITPSAGARGTSLLFRLDVRQPEDVQVVETPSWWTVAHLLYLIVSLLLASLLTTGWAILLRRRVSAQAERITRSMAMECERSRLLEQINSDQALHHLLSDICSSMAKLVPGIRCSCELFDLPGASPANCGMPKVNDFSLLFTAELTGPAAERVGVFRVERTESDSTARALSKEDRETLAAGASLANLAVNQRNLYQKLNYHSTHDQLTALPNRRLSDLRLDEALAAAGEGGCLVGVVYIDVDRFKQVNDEFGHKTGDLYLQHISARLSAEVRSSDLLARIGGDEFMLTAVLAGLEDAETYRQRLQSCFDDPFSLDGILIFGSASIGLAIYPTDGVTAEDLQRSADLDMYAVKERRRKAAAADRKFASGQRRAS